MLRGCPVESVLPYLLRVAECDTGACVAQHRLRALKCLLALAPPATLHGYIAPDRVRCGGRGWKKGYFVVCLTVCVCVYCLCFVVSNVWYATNREKCVVLWC